MNQERDLARAHTAPGAPTHDDDLAPGRGSRSSQLDAPSHPIAGGMIRRKARDANGVAKEADQAVAAASSSRGAALPDTIMRKFEASLGTDLSSVRVHTGALSESAADTVGAQAYTMGQNIHFGAGRYDPSSQSGQRLLAHEVAHTVQQSGSPTMQYKLEVSAPDDSAEIEADDAAAAMIGGRPASVTFGAGVARKVMRDAESGEARASGAVAKAGSGTKGTIHIAEGKLGEKKVGFFDLDVSFACDINYEATNEGTPAGPATAPHGPTAPSEPSNSYDQQHAMAPISPTVGTTSDPLSSDAGLQAELKKELDGGFTNFKPSLKGGVEITGKTVTVETALEYESKWGPITFTTSPLVFKILKWEAGKTPEVAVAGVTLAAAIPFKEWTSGSTKYKLDCQGKFSLEAKPDPYEIGKYIAEHAAKMLAAEFLVTAGFIAAGVITVAGALYEIAKSHEFTERTEPEVKKCRAYCHGYEAAMKGQAAAGEDEGSAEGFAHGMARRKAIEAGVAMPEGAVVEQAKSYDFYTEAWNKAWPQVKQRCIDSYWEEHYVEKFLTGGEGDFHFHIFKMLLDGWDRG